MLEGEGRKGPHPVVWFILYLPYGLLGGWAVVTLSWLLSRKGVSVEQIAVLGGIGLLPNIWKVLTAPLVDTTLSSRAWFMIGNGLMAAGLMIAAVLPLGPAVLPLLAWLAFLTSWAGTLTSIAADRLMAYDTRPEEKGRAGGWSQAGNLAGAGVGGGVGLWIAQQSGHAWLAGLALSLGCLACSWPLRRLADPAVSEDGAGFTSMVIATARDLLGLMKSRIGLLACFICILPMGTGGAQNVFSAVAKDWGAGPGQVALVDGVLNGLAGLVGCLIWGSVCDRMDRKRAMLISGLISAATAVAMALGPRTPMTYVVLVTVYNLAIGFCYGAFGAVALEAIGKGAAATKFNLISSASNVPLVLVTFVDGWAHDHWGAGPMLLTEAALGAGSVAIYIVVAWITRGWSWAGLGRALRFSPATSA
jgi:MFS family permease